MTLLVVHPASSIDRSLAEVVKWATILVPVALVPATALLRSLCYRTPFFSGKNLYLGMDLCFAGLAATMVEALDMIRDHLLQPEASDFRKLLMALALSFGNAIALLVATKIHQTWDAPPPRAKAGGLTQAQLNAQHRRDQKWALGFLANGIGLFALTLFMWLRVYNLV